MVSTETENSLFDNPLLITFVIKKGNNQWNVRCKGCREVHAPQGDSQHPFIRGFIEFEQRSIPVFDLVFQAQRTFKPITHAYCLIIVESAQQPFVPYIAILMENLDQVLRLASGDIDQRSYHDTDRNMILALDMMNDAQSLNGMEKDLWTTCLCDQPNVLYAH